jgi:hypothetical protein
MADSKCNCFVSALRSLGAILAVTLYAVEGLSCGLIKVPECVGEEHWDKEQGGYLGFFVRGYAMLTFIYYVVEIVFCLFYGYNDIFVLIMGIVSVLCASAIMVMAGNKYQVKLIQHGMFFSAIFLVIKYAHTGYVLVTMFSQPLPSGFTIQTLYICVAASVETLLFIYVTFFPLLLVKKANDEDMALRTATTVWAIENADALTLLVIIVSYAYHAQKGPDDPVLMAYFAFFAIDLVVFALPLYFTYKNKNYFLYHIMLCDFMTDVPVFIIALAGKTYVGNWVICINITVNVIEFAKGFAWLPVKICSKHYEQESMDTGIALGEVDEAMNSSAAAANPYA